MQTRPLCAGRHKMLSSPKKSSSAEICVRVNFYRIIIFRLLFLLLQRTHARTHTRACAHRKQKFSTRCRKSILKKKTSKQHHHHHPRPPARPPARSPPREWATRVLHSRARVREAIRLKQFYFLLKDFEQAWQMALGALARLEFVTDEISVRPFGTLV